MDNGERCSMRFHAAPFAALTRRTTKNEFGVTELGGQSLSAPVEFSIEYKAAAGAVLDSYDHSVFQALCHPEPVFRQSDEIGVVFDENRNIKFCLEKLAEVDIRTLKDRAPVCQTSVRIDKSRQPDANPACILDVFVRLLQASADAANDKRNQLRRGQLPRFDRDIVGRANVPRKIGDRKYDLMSGNLDADNMSVIRVQAKHDQGPTPPSGSKAVCIILNQGAFFNQMANNTRDRCLAQSGPVRQLRTR